MTLIQHKMFNSTAMATGLQDASLQPTEPVSVVWHRTPADILNAHWAPIAADAGVAVEDMAGEFGAVDENGEEFEFSLSDMEQSIVDMGCWGFADTKKRVMHLWAAPETDSRKLTELIAHELGHMTGKQADGEKEEEARADQYASVTLMTMDTLAQRPMQ